MKFNKIFKVILLFVFAVYLTGCSGKPVTFNSVDPKLYADKKSEGRTISGEASGLQLSALIELALLLFVITTIINAIGKYIIKKIG